MKKVRGTKKAKVGTGKKVCKALFFVLETAAKVQIMVSWEIHRKGFYLILLYFLTSIVNTLDVGKCFEARSISCLSSVVV